WRTGGKGRSSRLRPLPQGQMQGQGLAASAAPTGFAGADAPAVAVAVAVDLDLDLRGPSGAAESADKTPQGRRTRMCGVFRAGFDARSENPAGPADPVQSTGRAGRGVLSLRQVSLHKQRKVARAV